MRVAVPVAILLSASILLAGCSGGGDDEHLHYVCSNGTEIHADEHPEVNATKAEDLAKFCPGSSSTGSRSNSTSAAPNVLPTLVLKITDSGGNETPVTMLDGNLTFDASGSTDSDGQVAGIAVTVTDSNTTRTATLYDAAKKQFKTATFTFDRPGTVNVTVAMVDDRAGFSVNQTHVYVNHPQTSGGQTIQVPNADSLDPVSGSNCGGPTGNPLTDGNTWKNFPVTIAENATWLEAVVTSGNAVITLCSPDGSTELSEKGASIASTPGTPLPAPSGTASYYFGAFGRPVAGQATNIVIDVIVHYEPDTRSA